MIPPGPAAWAAFRVPGPAVLGRPYRPGAAGSWDHVESRADVT